MPGKPTRFTLADRSIPGAGHDRMAKPSGKFLAHSGTARTQHRLTPNERRRVFRGRRPIFSARRGRSKPVAALFDPIRLCRTSTAWISPGAAAGRPATPIPLKQSALRVRWFLASKWHVNADTLRHHVSWSAQTPMLHPAQEVCCAAGRDRQRQGRQTIASLASKSEQNPVSATSSDVLAAGFPSPRTAAPVTAAQRSLHPPA